MTEFADGFDPAAFKAEIAALLRAAPLAELGPGRPKIEFRLALDKLAKTPISPHLMSGLWLLFDFLDESHDISQNLADRDGSYWHGFMHRREPDAGNAAYWFRRVGDHPIFSELPGHVFPAFEDRVTRAELLDGAGRWNPFAFIDLCEANRGGNSDRERALRQIQWIEWQSLARRSLSIDGR
jgi:hypothetical protein